MIPLQLVTPEEQQAARDFIASCFDHDLLSYYLRVCSYALSTAKLNDPLYTFYAEIANTCHEKVKGLPRSKPYMTQAEKIMHLTEIAANSPKHLQDVAQIAEKVKMRADAAAALLNAPDGYAEKLESFYDHATEELRKFLNI